jgi:hypothetical protein
MIFASCPSAGKAVHGKTDPGQAGFLRAHQKMGERSVFAHPRLPDYFYTRNKKRTGDFSQNP